MSKIEKLRNSILPALLVILIANWAGNLLFFRFDLTNDKRYTISDSTINVLNKIESPIRITVFLDGNLPTEFRKLKLEIEQLLREFSLKNEKLEFHFINPLEDSESGKKYREIIQSERLKGIQVKSTKQGQSTIEQLFPWAVIEDTEKKVTCMLLKNHLGSSREELINNSIQNLEYSFIDGIKKLIIPKEKKIAILKGNKELEDIYLADLLSSLRDYYFLAPFTLDSVKPNPQGTLKKLEDYDLIVVAKPEIAFSTQEKYVLDQYLMNGGKTIWLVDVARQESDSISDKTYILPIDLSLDDFFFNYGIRFNRNVLKDIYAAPITLANGSGRNSQFEKFPWFYSPLIKSSSSHPIVTNLDPIKFDFVGEIDTLRSSTQKTIILNTSDYTKRIGLPTQIDFNSEITQNLRVINQGPNSTEFNLKKVPVAVLLEGEFKSAYANRIKPFTVPNNREKSVSTKMIVISDGDLIKNQLENGRPLELGFDKWTGELYGNKEFMLNSINYLLDEEGILKVRTKNISIPVLDTVKTNKKRFFWQFANLLSPLIFVISFGIFFRVYRKRKYSK